MHDMTEVRSWMRLSAQVQRASSACLRVCCVERQCSQYFFLQTAFLFFLLSDDEQ